MGCLILTQQGDTHAAHMADHLLQRGVRVWWLDSLAFPAAVQISLRHDASPRLKLPDGTGLLWSDVESVYWRGYPGVGAAPLPQEEQAWIAWNDARSLMEALLTLPGPKWVNGWQGFQLHQRKPAALRQVANLGVRVPATLWTNDPLEARAFLQQHPQVVFKPVQGGAHTRRLNASEVTEDQLRRLSLAPVTFQEEIAGTNVRAFVAGDEVLACEVRSEEIDFRDDDDPGLLVHELPAEVKEMAISVARSLDLLWSGIDFRLTPGGEYVFLEANPSPMFLGFEEATGLPLTGALARLLAG